MARRHLRLSCRNCGVLSIWLIVFGEFRCRRMLFSKAAHHSSGFGIPSVDRLFKTSSPREYRTTTSRPETLPVHVLWVNPVADLELA